MANQKIHEYLIERYTIGDDDYFDIDYYDGAVYTTAKVKGSVIKALAAAINIYTTDGALMGDRTIDGANYGIEWQNLDYEQKSILGVTPAQTDLVSYFINPTSLITGGRLFTIQDIIGSKRRFAILKTGEVEVNEAYRLPLTDGTIGQVLATDGAGNLFFQTAAGNNIYNIDGTLLADRTLTGDNFLLLFQTMGQFIVESHKNGVDGNIIFEVRTDPTNHSFIIRDHNTGVHILACRNGQVEISDAYFLPNSAGTNGQYLRTDGAGTTSWSDMDWQPPHVQLFDAVSSGGLTTQVNALGAGYNRYFNGSGTAGVMSFNIPLKTNGINYNGALIQVRIQNQIFSTNGGGVIRWKVDYKFVTANGTTNAEVGVTTINTDINVVGRGANLLYNDLIATISGASNSDILMLNITRVTGGASTNTNITDAIGVSLTRV